MTNGMQGGIRPRSYKAGSIIYFEGDKSEYVYILKTGRVLLTYVKIDTGEEVKEEVRQGEFFGVKSALGKYPREETAQTIGETVVLVLTLGDFERMILRNVNVVRKMLRVFSNQLRRIGKTVRTVLGESENVNPDLELFRIGEHYFKAGDFNKATYAFKKYLEYYPGTEYSRIAMERIKTINSGGPIPSGGGSGDDLGDFSMESDSDDMFTFDEAPVPKAKPAPVPAPQVKSDPAIATEFSSEMDDFLSDDSSLDDFGDFDLDSSPAASPGLKPRFDEGESLFKRQNYPGALEIFQGILDDGEPAKNGDLKYFVDSHFYAGVCYYEMKKFKESMNLFAEIIKNRGDSEKYKGAVFYAGQIFEAAGQKDKAITYYNKVLNITPSDSLNGMAMDKIKALQRGR
ncbi:MAG TPA: cyclic nucleotide-binding domain-containing protein [Spirochaetota bacterium]|nr:cyclic nucleotide-binding domain-containing protein [Spirochaetota bacterium]HPJ42915.1 cyclic nucleotide-binding domain-containing protein [Spirochaetota bacterium]HPR36286.1 cyclic nucleotide-binding domain-containing protein [Spirochaetota bacterium]HRX48133.1 cyclic nucleotide-binding domain-containing protein [Spirochaetota bacterium]